MLETRKGRKTMSATTVKEIKTSAEQMIELLKKLPETKQEFVNGYVQGVNEALAEQNKTA